MYLIYTVYMIGEYMEPLIFSEEECHGYKKTALTEPIICNTRLCEARRLDSHHLFLLTAEH